MCSETTTASELNHLPGKLLFLLLEYTHPSQVMGKLYMQGSNSTVHGFSQCLDLIFVEWNWTVLYTPQGLVTIQNSLMVYSLAGKVTWIIGF